jgi:hypothetical protein
MTAYVDNITLLEALRVCVQSTGEEAFKALPAVRQALQSTPSTVLRNTTVDTNTVQSLTRLGSDIARKSSEHAALMLTLAQVVKKCRIDQKDLHFIVSALQASLRRIATSTIAEATEFMSTVMTLHQVEDILSQLGVNRLDSLQGLAESLPDCLLLLSQLRSGSLQFNSPHGDQYDIDIAKVFGMIAEISSQTELTAVVLQQISAPLQTATDRLIDVVECSKVAHDGYLSAFQHVLSLSSLANVSASSLMIHFDRCVSLLTSISLDNVVDAKRVEILVGYLSCFFDSVHEDASKESKHDIAYRVLHQHDVESSFVDRLVDALMQLQASMKQQMQSLAKDKKKSSKDHKVIFSEIRKGTISCMENVLLQDRVWLQDKNHKKKFWDLSIKSLCTPVLFATAYNTSLKSSTIMTKQIIDYLVQALEMLTNYSVSSAEDIVETIRQLVQYKCVELLVHPKLLPLLIYSLEHFPKGLGNDNLEGQWKWKTSIVSCLHELYQQLLQVQIHTSSLSDTFLTSTTALMKILFLENIQEHIKANSKFATSSSSSGTGKRKQSSMTDKMDESVELFHTALPCLTAIFEFLFFLQSFPTTIAYDEMILCCVEGAVKPIVFEDDYMDIMLSLELLARVAAVYHSTSQCSLAHGHIIATIATICVAGCSASDVLSDRVRTSLQLYSNDSHSSSNLLNQLFTILTSSAKVSTLESDSLNTSCLAALGTLLDHLPSSDGKLLEILRKGQDANSHRIEILRQFLTILK